MTEEDWKTIDIAEINMTDNSDLIFVTFRSKDDVTRFTSKAKNLPQEQGEKTPRIAMYVDRRAAKRHKAYLKIAKTLRENSNEPIQTSLRTGKNDFLLRIRTKGSTQPWNEIPPLKINQIMPEFEIGNFNDIVNPSKNTPLENLEEEDEQEQIEGIQEIENEISRQNSYDSRMEKTNNDMEDITEDDKNNKRDRTKDNTNNETLRENKKSKPEKNVNKEHNMSQTIPETENSGDESEEDSKKILNSTPIYPQQGRIGKSTPYPKKQNKEIMHYFSVPETPGLTKQMKGKQSVIPETPETEHLNKSEDPTTRNKNKTTKKTIENKEQDNAIIKELFNKTNKTTNSNNE